MLVEFTNIYQPSFTDQFKKGSAYVFKNQKLIRLKNERYEFADAKKIIFLFDDEKQDLENKIKSLQQLKDKFNKIEDLFISTNFN